MRARVIAEHRAPDRPAIRVAAGDAVLLGDRDTEWPQFAWTTVVGGLGGWIPAILFDRDAGAAIALQDYDTRELDADVGDELRLHHELAGWWWAERIAPTADGASIHSGWIPTRAIEPIAASSAADTPIEEH